MTTNILKVSVLISFCHNIYNKTLIWLLTYHPLVLRHLLPLLMHMRNLLTLLKNNLQIIKKKSEFDCKNGCWWWCPIIWNTKNNNHSVFSLGAQAFIGILKTPISFRRNLHMPFKKSLNQEKRLLLFSKRY